MPILNDQHPKSRLEQAYADGDYELVSELTIQEQIVREQIAREMGAYAGFDYLRSHKPWLSPDSEA